LIRLSAVRHLDFGNPTSPGKPCCYGAACGAAGGIPVEQQNHTVEGCEQRTLLLRAAGGAIASVGHPLDFRDGVYHSREGPWEVMTPRSSSLEGNRNPLRGANLRLTAKIKTLAQRPLIRRDMKKLFASLGV
jgi:hypothetical protein